MENLLKDAYDLHIHCGPDILPRSVTGLEMAQRAAACGMRGFAIKSHYAPTCLQAATVRASVEGINAVGTVTLNTSVGGLNPYAVETAARMGAKIVWCPTFDSYAQLDYYINNIPQYIKMQKKFMDMGEKAPAIKLTDENGVLVREMEIIIDICKEYNMVLATGHITHEETFVLAREAHKRALPKLLLTHADWEFTHYSVEEQKELVALGAYVEHSYTSPAEGAVPWDKVFDEIRAIGPEHCIITSDLGKAVAQTPEQGLLDYAERLRDAGFSLSEIRTMLCEVPAFLVET